MARANVDKILLSTSSAPLFRGIHMGGMQVALQYLTPVGIATKFLSDTRSTISWGKIPCVSMRRGMEGR